MVRLPGLSGARSGCRAHARPPHIYPSRAVPCRRAFSARDRGNMREGQIFRDPPLAGMHLGAGIALAMDIKGRKVVLDRIQTDAFRFTRSPTGAWVWHMTQARRGARCPRRRAMAATEIKRADGGR